MDDQFRHFLIAEAEAVQHKRPIDSVCRHKDVLPDNLRARGPEIRKVRERRANFRRRVYLIREPARKTDVIHQRVKPDIRDKTPIERQFNAPVEALLGTRDAKIAADLVGCLHDVRPSVSWKNIFWKFDEKAKKPLAVEFEIIILLAERYDLPPLQAVLTIRVALLVREKLLRADAVKALVGRLVDLPAVKEPLQCGLHHPHVPLVGRGRPTVIADAELPIQREKFLRVAVGKFARADALLVGRLRDFLAVLIDTREEIRLPAA